MFTIIWEKIGFNSSYVHHVWLQLVYLHNFCLVTILGENSLGFGDIFFQLWVEITTQVGWAGSQIASQLVLLTACYGALCTTPPCCCLVKVMFLGASNVVATFIEICGVPCLITPT